MSDSSDKSKTHLSRRTFLVAGGVAAAGAISFPLVKRALATHQPVFVARNQKYDGPLRRTIEDGLIATGLDPVHFRGKKVLLKPNLVEPTRSAPQMTTNPAMVVAAAEVFQNWGAEVKVGEG